LRKSKVKKSGGSITNTDLLQEKVTEIYQWLDRQISQAGPPAGCCQACGRCCHFSEYNHRLFITSPELLYFAAKLGPAGIKPMPTDLCPYNTAGRCRVYPLRFAGCRIFCCSRDADLQNRLSEAVLTKLRNLCTQLKIPYRYMDLAVALNTWPLSSCR